VIIASEFLTRVDWKRFVHFRVRTTERRRTLSGQNGGTICTVIFDILFLIALPTAATLSHSSDGRFVCAGSDDGSLVIWNAQSTKVQTTLKRNRRFATLASCWYSQGILTGEQNGDVTLWCD
jgi:WD40 repeat protein